jgi:DHA2 family multidrug resistance protein
MIVLTGWLVRTFGRKRLLLIATLGFMVSSLCCGLSTSLPEMVTFRIIQGLCGAVFVPISQYVLRDTFPPEQQGLAMSIWGMGIMVAPILGPTLGGYITDEWSWRWIFFLNIPCCLAAFALTLRYIQDTPRIKLPTDRIGIVLLILGVGSLQMLLDRGNQEGWWQSSLIIGLTFLAVVGIVLFLYRCLKNPYPVIHLSIFRNRNFCLSTTMLALYFAAIFGCIILQPILMQGIMGYTPWLTGLVFMPRGIASLVGMLLVAILIRRIDVRYIIAAGILLSFWGTYQMTHFFIGVDAHTIASVAAIQGFGMGLTLVPLSALSMSSLDKKDIPEAAGLFSFGRNLGNSIGVSLLSTLVTRGAQAQWLALSTHLQPFNLTVTEWLAALPASMPTPSRYALLEQTISTQATLIAFLHSYQYACLVLLLILLFIPFLQISKQGPLTLTIE